MLIKGRINFKTAIKIEYKNININAGQNHKNKSGKPK